MKRYADIFLDFDDTLYDTHGNACLALVDVYNKFGLGRYFERIDDFTVPYWRTNEELWGRYSRGEIEREYLIVERFRRPLSLGRDYNPTDTECLTISDFFLDRCCEQTGVVDGAYDLLDYLKGRGYGLHMTSNGFHEVQYRKLAKVGMDRYFDTIILSEDAGANKPSKEFFDYAFRVSGAKPESTILIGDNVMTDILGARQAGLPQIWFNASNKTSPDFPITHIVPTLMDIKDIL